MIYTADDHALTVVQSGPTK